MTIFPQLVPVSLGIGLFLLHAALNSLLGRVLLLAWLVSSPPPSHSLWGLSGLSQKGQTEATGQPRPCFAPVLLRVRVLGRSPPFRVLSCPILSFIIIVVVYFRRSTGERHLAMVVM